MSTAFRLILVVYCSICLSRVVTCGRSDDGCVNLSFLADLVGFQEFSDQLLKIMDSNLLVYADLTADLAGFSTCSAC